MTINIDLLLDSFLRKAPWQSVIEPVLKACELPKANGVEKTISKLRSIYSESVENEQNSSKSFEKLQEFYCDYLLTGEKYVNLFRINRVEIDKLIAYFKEYKCKESSFKSRYPYSLSSSELKKIKSFTPELVSIRDVNNGDDSALFLVFCGKRYYTERTEILPNSLDLGEKSLQYLNQYQKIYGVTQRIYQSFDIIVLWKNKEIIEIRSDLKDHFSIQESRDNANKILRKFNDLVMYGLGIKNETLNTKNLVNLFSLIDKIYKNSNEGHLLRIHFVTDEGTQHDEKIKHSNDDTDFRKTTYHLAGKKGVSDNITLFNLMVIWRESDAITKPKLQLPGTVYSLNNTILNEAIIENCVTIKDYNFVFHKILRYLYGNIESKETLLHKISKEAVLHKIQEDWKNYPQQDICVKILNYLLENQKSRLILSHLTFATLRRVVGKNYTDENLLSAIQYLCGTRISILEAKFELIINGETFEISNEEVRAAQKTGEIVHPISGDLFSDIDNLIFMYFSACSISF